VNAGEGPEAVEGLADLGPAAWAFHRNTVLTPFGETRWEDGASDRWFPQRPEEDPLAPYEPLPPPLPLRSRLGATLRARRSCRRFADRAVDRGQLATLLHAGYGVGGLGDVDGGRPVPRATPSAGGLYPLELYALLRSATGLEPGTWHYTPITHGLERMAGPIPSPTVRELFAGQAPVAEAAAVVVMAAAVRRCMPKYGDRAYRYLLIEVGHAGQNVNLAAACLGLGSLDVGAFADLELGAALGLDPELQIPLYAVAVGVPADPGTT
jgi:SagB-type dehydrogenase family enzyme